MLAWTRALFLVGFLVVIVLSDAASPQVGDTYRGGYFCGQGYTDVSIYVQSNTTASSWMVLFTYSVPTSPFCTGSYTASVSGSGSTLTMTGSSWISHPCGYVFLSTFTLIIQGTNATPVWYTASIGAGCQQLLVGKSTLRKPCSGVKNDTTSLALICSIETDTSTPTNAKTVSTSWTEAQSRHSASTSFALSSASSSRSCELCSVTHSSSSSQSVVHESSASSMSPANSISTTFPAHSVQKSSSHSQSLASSPSSTASMSLPVLRTTTNSHSRTTQHSPSVALKRSDSATRSRTQRSHEHSLTLATVNKSASIPVMSLTTTTTYPNIKTTLTRSSKSSSLFIVPPPPTNSVPDLQRISAVAASSVLFVGSVAGAGSTAGSSRIGALSVAQCAIVDASNTADGIAGLFPFGYLVPGDCLLSSAHADDITAIIGNFIIVVVALVFFFFVCSVVALRSKALSIVEATRLFTFPLCVMPLWYAAVPSTAAAASHLVASFGNRVEGCPKTVTVVAIVGILIPAVTIGAVVFTLFYANAHFTTNGALERLAMPFPSTDRSTYFVRRILRIVKWSLRVCVHWVESPVLLEATSIISEESAAVRVTNKGKDPKFLVTRHFNALLSEYSFIPYALLDLTNTVIVSLLSGAALAIGSTSWCIANNAVAFTLFFVQLVVCIAVRPYVAWFFFLHSCSIQCLVVASAACSLSVAILISNGEGDSSAAGSLNTAASVLNLLAMGLSVVRIAIDLRSLVVALLRIGRAKKTSLRNSNDGEVNQESRNALLTAQWDAPDILHCEVSSYGGDACTENSSVLKIDNNDDDEEHKRSGSCTIASPSSGGPVHVLSSGEEQILQAQFWDDLGHCRTSTEIVHDKFNNFFLERDL